MMIMQQSKHVEINNFFITSVVIRATEVKSVPLLACSDPEGSRKLRFTYYLTMAQDGGKAVSLTHQPPLPPGNTPGTHFC